MNWYNSSPFITAGLQSSGLGVIPELIPGAMTIGVEHASDPFVIQTMEFPPLHVLHPPHVVARAFCTPYALASPSILIRILVLRRRMVGPSDQALSFFQGGHV